MRLTADSFPQTTMHDDGAASIDFAELSLLAASIAHEVNQPLSGIITNASTCLRMLASDPPNISGALETARRTIRDGNRAAEIVTQLRALFAHEESLLERVDLNEATHEAIARTWSELQRNRVILQLDLADVLPPVAGVRVQLQQVILNLIRNGMEAMKEVEDRPRLLRIRTEKDGWNGVQLTVTDSGIGLDPPSLANLFKPFHTTKQDGMGIGLCVSRSIVERFLGRLWAARNDGHGCSFAFSIPCYATRSTKGKVLRLSTAAKPSFRGKQPRSPQKDSKSRPTHRSHRTRPR